jgi:hypothetical protein
MCEATGMHFQESPFPGRQESYKNVHCSSSKVLIITDESQQKLSCEVRNANPHKNSSKRNQDTQNKLHEFSRNLILITDRWK